MHGLLSLAPRIFCGANSLRQAHQFSKTLSQMAAVSISTNLCETVPQRFRKRGELYSDADGGNSPGDRDFQVVSITGRLSMPV